MAILSRALVALVVVLVAGGLYFAQKTAPAPQESTAGPAGQPGGALTNGTNPFENSTQRTGNATALPTS